MEKRYRAQEFYNKYRKEEEDPRPTKHLMLSIFQIILEYLTLCKPEEKFSFHEFHKILNLSSTECDFSLEKASKAFERLEFYLVTIWKNSWKPEFKRMRKYCGFYQTKIESHLKKSEEVFKLIGYVESADCLVLNRRLNQDVVLSVGFECIVASIECHLVSKIIGRLDSPLRPCDVFTWRQKYSGGEEEFVTLLNGNKKDPVLKSSSGSEYRNDTEVDHNSVTFSPGHRDIPFIDDDADGHREYEHVGPNFEEGTLDDHLMASLKLVSKEKVKVEEPPPKKGSDEWSYVTESLKKRYGEEYNWGTRGDILQPEQLIPQQTQDSRNDKNEVQKRITRKESSSYRDSGYVGGSSFRNTSHRSELVTRATGGAESKMSSLSKPTHPISYAHEQLSPPNATGNLNVCVEEEGIGGENLYNDIVEMRYERLGTTQPFNFSHSAPVARKISTDTERSPSSSSRFGSHSLNEGGWVCPYCTIRNPKGNLICSVCSKTNDVRDIKPSSKSMDVRWTSRQCSKCTYANQSDRSECEMCGNPINEANSAV